MTASPVELVAVDDVAARGAAARSRLYQVLAMAFGFPDEALHSAVCDGSFRSVLIELWGALPYAIAAEVPSDLQTAPAYLEFESEYIRLFDVGAAGPPCPLYGGVYGGDRMKVMEDATRFYNFFALRLSPSMHELPDHITTELEFLHYLTFREAAARQQDPTSADPAPLLRAERDFLTRHLCKWVPRLQAKLAKQRPLPFFAALVQVAAAFFAADQAYAAGACTD
jgi:DMSO reductase family type II enzyme chaperone